MIECVDEGDICLNSLFLMYLTNQTCIEQNVN